MKHILLFVLFTISQLAMAQKNHVLVPYRKGELMGLSDLDGKIVLKPMYSRIEPMGENFFKFTNYTLLVDSVLQGNGIYKKRTSNQSRSGVISGKKVIIPESEYNAFVLVPEGFIVGAMNNYTKDGGMFYNKSGKKLLNDGVLSYRFVSFARASNPNGADHSAIIVAYKDLSYNILDFQNSTQQGVWLFDKSVSSLVLDRENGGDDYFVMTYVDKQGNQCTKKVYYDAEKNQVVMADFSKMSQRYSYPELNYSNGAGTGEYSGSNGAGAGQYSGEERMEVYIAPEVSAPTDDSPIQSAPPRPVRSLFTLSEDGILKYGEHQVSFDDKAKLHFYEPRSRVQGQPVIFELKNKFGIIYSDSMKMEAIYDSLIYLKALSRSPTMGQYYYLAGKKQNDNSFLLGVLDMEGKEVIPFEYSSIIPGMLELELKEDEMTAEASFEYKKPEVTYRQARRSMEMDRDNIFTATRNGSMGLIDINNEIILPFEYQIIFKNKLHFSTATKAQSNFNVYLKNNLYGVFGLNGKRITENSNPQFPDVPVFYYNDYAGIKGLKLYNLAIPSNLFYYVASEDGKLYIKN